MKATYPGPSRRDRLIQELEHDPYKTRLKLPEPSVCPDCHAVFHKGRWQWLPPPEGAHRETCQACNRVRDGFPAGTMTCSGDFVRTHRDEIVNLARHQARLENMDHPLHRIMTVAELPDAVTIRTTDIHLPRRIGEAVRRAFKGSLHVHYEEGSYSIRVSWEREA